MCPEFTSLKRSVYIPVFRNQPHEIFAAFDLHDIALLQYTGGTTGPAKGVMLSNGNLSFHVQQLRSWLPSPRAGRSCLSMSCAVM